jgi:hypothetical protein
VNESKLKLRWTFGGTAAFFRFYGELSDFLPPARRGRMLLHRFDVSPSVKAAIEGFGVPHPEVGLIVANREAVDFSYAVGSGDFIGVYPAFHSIDVSSLVALRPPLEGTPRFVLDVHLGRLAAYLRLMGFDSLYRNHAPDDELAREAGSGGRVLLTRDRGLLKRNEVFYGYWLRATEPRRQLLDVVRRYDLIGHADLFTRCLVCNTVLDIVDKGAVAAAMPERAREQFDELRRCPGCARVYWKGSHYRRMLHMVGRIMRAARR